MKNPNNNESYEKLRKEVCQFYKISGKEYSLVCIDEKINISLYNSISLREFKYWKSGNILGGTFRNDKTICFMISTIQCLAYIPDLTRLLLDNFFFKDIPDKENSTSFLHIYINILKLLFKETDKLAENVFEN
jgi:ubiquitin C-terminal hydrolase